MRGGGRVAPPAAGHLHVGGAGAQVVDRLYGKQNGVFFFSGRGRHTRWNCDWSSDVCSSDLRERDGIVEPGEQKELLLQELAARLEAVTDANGQPVIRKAYRADQMYSGGATELSPDLIRSEERRVGKECSSRRAPDAQKKKQV